MAIASAGSTGPTTEHPRSRTCRRGRGSCIGLRSGLLWGTLSSVHTLRPTRRMTPRRMPPTDQRTDTALLVMGTIACTPGCSDVRRENHPRRRGARDGDQTAVVTDRERTWCIMFASRRLAPIAGAALLLITPVNAADNEPPRKPAASKLDLTPASFATLHGLVRPQPTEWRHLQVRWITDVIAARRQAAAEDKPIVVLYTGGGRGKKAPGGGWSGAPPHP